MQQLLFATGNAGKLRELRELLAETLPAEVTPTVLGLADLPRRPPEVVEDGETFAANAVIKARAAVLATGLPAIADDSGLEVDAMGGRPGVRSARYGGPGLSDADRNQRLLDELSSVAAERRTARFRCAVAFVHPDRAEHAVIREGRCEGRILEAPRGSGGFGYDPLFFVAELGQTFAEAAPADKNRLSHRGEAMRQMAAFMRHLLLL
jgi:XTP/dITP diphosphohydrolase